MRYLIILLFSYNLFAITIDDIQTMRDFDILIKFKSTEKAKTISELEVSKDTKTKAIKITPNKFLEVKYISFNKKNVNVLPNWISKLEYLEGLDLSGANTTLKELDKIKNLKNLTMLNLNNNPNFFSESKEPNKELISLLQNFKINELYLSNVGANIEYFQGLGEFISLTGLDLSNNNLSEVTIRSNDQNPTSKNFTFKGIGLNKLANLETLKLNNCKLNGDFLPSLIPIESIKELSLASNTIKKFTYEKYFPQLRMLDLSQNSNIEIDEKYSNIFSLQKLVQLKRNSDVKVPKNLEERLKVIRKKEINKNVKKENIKTLKELGIDGTHNTIKNSDNIELNKIPLKSIVYLKKDLHISRGKYHIDIFHSYYKSSPNSDSRLVTCILGHSLKDVATDNIIIEKGILLEVSETDKKYKYNDNKYILKFTNSAIRYLECKGADLYTNIIKDYMNDTIELFIKKPVVFNLNNSNKQISKNKL
jgi:Leucine-rich repeat (LRR) protein